MAAMKITRETKDVLRLETYRMKRLFANWALVAMPVVVGCILLQFLPRITDATILTLLAGTILIGLVLVELYLAFMTFTTLVIELDHGNHVIRRTRAFPGELAPSFGIYLPIHRSKWKDEDVRRVVVGVSGWDPNYARLDDVNAFVELELEAGSHLKVNWDGDYQEMAEFGEKVGEFLGKPVFDKVKLEGTRST